MKVAQRPEYGPPEIRALDQWVVTKLTPRPGRPNNKPPYIQDSHGGLRLASGPVDSRSHMPYAQAASLVRHHVSGMTWPGFVTLPTSHITGGDLDSCRNPRTGALGLCGPLGFHAGALVAYLPTYWSVSPSGRGLRFWARGEVPDGPRREGGHLKLSTVGLEMYSQGQYLTETGLWLRSTPTRAAPLQSRLSLLARAADALAACHAGGRSRLASLWGQPGNSESDLALANALAPFVQGDPEVLDLLLRLSGAYRDRWDSPRSGSTWLREFVVRVALERPPPGSPSVEAPGDLVEKRLAYLQADAEARRRLSAASAPPPPAPLLQAGAWMDADIPDPTYLVPTLWVEGTNILLAAEYKAGKTTLVLNTLRSLLGGGPLLGLDAAPPSGSVVLVNAEMPPAQLRLWIREAIPRPLLSKLFVLNVVGEPFDLGQEATRDWLASELRRVGASVVILDTFSALFFGEENSNSEVMSFLRGLDSMKATGGCPNLMLVHHLGRKAHEEGKEHGRGASVLDGWAGARWILVRDGDSRWLSASGRDVLVKDLELEYNEVTRLLGAPATGRTRREARSQGAAERAARIQQSVVMYVRSHPGCSVQELRVGLGGRAVDVSRALASALSEGAIEDRAEHLPGVKVPKRLVVP